jgi:hypothetical protein
MVEDAADPGTFSVPDAAHRPPARHLTNLFLEDPYALCGGLDDVANGARSAGATASSPMTWPRDSAVLMAPSTWRCTRCSRRSSPTRLFSSAIAMAHSLVSARATSRGSQPRDGVRDTVVAGTPPAPSR